MPFKIPEWNDIQRNRILALLLLLAFVVSMPTPTGSLTSRQDVAILIIWIGTLCTAWSVWFRRDLLDLFWVVAALGALLSFLFKNTVLSLVGLVIWRVWFFYREKRVSSLVVVLVILLFSPMAKAATESPVSTSSTAVGDNIAYLRGYKINDLTSCRQVDVVPWTFNKDNRQVRLLLKDRLRLSTEIKYSNWSVYQTMDPEGNVTFIFERTQSDGSSEYQLTKGNVYNRIVKHGRNRSVAEVKDLKNLIDSPALEFYHEDGSRLTFMPGSGGSSKLQVYLAARPGARILPPLFIDGRHCSRPESAFDQDDSSGKKAAGSPPAPTAAVVGGVSSAGAAPGKK